MQVYKVKRNQNIFDVAVSTHGSIEGIFDLLINNPDLSFHSQLKEDEEIFDIHASRRPARRLRRKRAGTAGDRRGQGAGRRRAADAADGREVQCARRPPAAHVGERRGRLVGFALVVQRLFPGRAVVRLRERPQPPGAGVRPDVHRTRRAGKTHHRQP